ncbi:MAG: universal stress protein, partial [Desulfobacterales bacterium]|nr:universal stress protein [Desulfobacterales bacterium]
PVPVIILPQDVNASGSGQQAVFRHVIFATDWAPSSEKAMGCLLNFAEIVKELEVVHVIDKKPSVRDMRNLKKKLTESRKIFLDHGIDAEGHIYAGKPSDEIVLAARNYDATCIVMGTTGKSALKNFFSHGCSYRVAEGSGVPTLVVP